MKTTRDALVSHEQLHKAIEAKKLINKSAPATNWMEPATLYKEIQYIPAAWSVHQTTTSPVCYSRTGYGSKLPTGYMVNDGTRNRRVYAICYSNAASFYVLVKGDKLFIQNYRFHEEDSATEHYYGN